MSKGPHTLLARTVQLMAAQLLRPIDYIEVGVCIGNSALSVLGTDCIRKYTGIDNWIWSFDGDRHLGEKDLREKLNGYPVELITGDSAFRLSLMQGLKENYDIGFVDGDHSDAACLTDMKLMWPLIRKGGVMLVDDIRNPNHTLEPVVMKFAEEKGVETTYYEDHEGVLALHK